MSRLVLTAAPAAAGRPDPGPVLAFSWEALSSRPDGAQPWEKRFPLDASDELEAFTLALAAGWHRDGGRDFTERDGVSLGAASRWLLWQLSLQPGAKLFAALAAAADAGGVDGFVLDASVPEPYRSAALCAAEALGLPLESAGGGAAPASSDVWRAPESGLPLSKRAAMAALDAAGTRRGSRPEILCAWYHTLEPVLPELAALGFRPVFADCPPRSKLTAFVVAGHGAWTPSPGPAPALDAVAAAWRKRRDSAEFDALCRWRGRSLKAFVAPLIDAIVERELPAHAATAADLRKKWRARRPAALVLPYDGPPLQQLLLQLARLEGTPSAILLHGLPLGYRFRFEHRDSDRFVVWGPEQERLYRAASPRPGQTIVGAGNPAFDRYAPAPPSGRRELLLLSHPLNRWSPRASSVDPELSARAMVDAALASGGWEVTLKLHPSESKEHYERVLGRRERLTIARDEPLEPLIRRAELVAGGFSTVLVEALLLGRPAICVNLTAEIDPPPFTAEHGLPPAKTAGELEARLRAAWTERAAPSGNAEILAKFAGVGSSPAAARTAKAIADMIQEAR